MAASVEFAPKIFNGEMYGHSNAGIPEMGRVALRGVGVDSDPIFTHNYDNYETAVTENITTDIDFGDRLFIDTPKVRQIVNGRVVGKNGEPIGDMIANGAEASRQMAIEDEGYLPQAFRDVGDVLVMEEAETLQVGESLFAVSMDPKEQLKKDRQRWEKMGYKEGMAVVHQFYKIDEETMLIWTYTIKESDKSAIAQLQQEDYDVDIDESTHSDAWVRHMHRSFMSREEAEAVGPRILARHKELTGSKIDYRSATEFVETNNQLLKDYFETYLVSLSKALVTGENNNVMKELAVAINGSVSGFAAEVQRGLMRVANRATFDSDDSRLMQAMIRYATVEELRKRLPAFLEAPKPPIIPKSKQPPDSPVSLYYLPAQVNHTYQRVHEMNLLIAGNIGAGVIAKRSVGGCSAVELHDDNQDVTNPALRNNMIDSVERTENSRSEMGKDGRGPLWFQCKKKHWNKREDFKDDIEECKQDGCSEKVGCVDPSEEPSTVTRLSDYILKKANNE